MLPCSRGSDGGSDRGSSRSNSKWVFIKCFLGARHCAKHFLPVLSPFFSNPMSYELGAISYPFLWTRLREPK